MGPVSYLQRLATHLGEGLLRQPEEYRSRHVAYLLGRQNADGGFVGRSTESDLYYTGFALRSLAVLDALTPDVVDRSSQFLRANLMRQASVVDFFSLLYASLLLQMAGGPDILANAPADWPDRVAATLESFTTPDGGYAKGVGGHSGSTYHTFLVGLCYQLLGRDLPRPDEVQRFILSRRRDDGGFVEIGPMRRAGTNPTAAAVGVLQLLANRGEAPREIPEEVREGVIEFLVEMPSMEGGLRANGRIPIADLLSTFTGAWTLAELNALDRVEGEALAEYAYSLEMPEGGYRGGIWDEQPDVEYTFYGLGVTALLG